MTKLEDKVKHHSSDETAALRCNWVAKSVEKQATQSVMFLSTLHQLKPVVTEALKGKVDVFHSVCRVAVELGVDYKKLGGSQQDQVNYLLTLLTKDNSANLVADHSYLILQMINFNPDLPQVKVFPLQFRTVCILKQSPTRLRVSKKCM